MSRTRRPRRGPARPAASRRHPERPFGRRPRVDHDRASLPPRYRSAMRLLLDAEIRDDTVAELRGLDTGLEVVDVRAEPRFDMEALADAELEVIVGPRAPSD